MQAIAQAATWSPCNGGVEVSREVDGKGRGPDILKTLLSTKYKEYMTTPFTVQQMALEWSIS